MFKPFNTAGAELKISRMIAVSWREGTSAGDSGLEQ